jgi:hypothetical protein
MNLKRLLIILSIALAFAGQTVNAQQTNADISPADLRAKAEKGDAVAQFNLSIGYH